MASVYFRFLVSKRWRISLAIIFTLGSFYTLRGAHEFLHGKKDTGYELKAEWFRVKSTLHESQLRLLPKLKELKWPAPSVSPLPAGILLPNGKRMDPAKPFEPTMSTGQLRLYRRLLKTFAVVMSDNGFGDRFMLTAGTLAGSFHHHDFIPWDDEIDILVDVEVREEVRALLKSLAPEYLLHMGSARDKFFARETNVSEYSAETELSKKVSRFKWNWPFLDLPYYTVNQTHVTELHPSYIKQMSWAKDIVFPLYFRPFGPDWFPAPKNPLAFLRARYGEGNTCKVIGYSHALEKRCSSGVTKCETLAARYPFVAHGPCEVIDATEGKNKVSLNEETLLTYAGYVNSTVIHRLCLAAASENAAASIFYYKPSA